MQPLDTDRLHIKIAEEELGKVRLLWSGTSDDRDPARLLNPYLDSVVEELGSLKVEIDFCAMDYMNSATVPPLLRLVRALNRKGIDTTVVYDSAQTFQRTAFSAFKALASVMPHLTVAPR